MKISHKNPLVLMALTWVSGSVSDARIIGGKNSNIHSRGLSDKDKKDDDKYQVYACNPCTQEVFADFNFLGKDSTVHVNHGKCKSIGALKRNKHYKIEYTAYTKTGTDMDDNTITRTDVDIDKVSDINQAESGFDNDNFPLSLSNLLQNSSVPGNSRVVELSCPAEMDS